MGCDGKQASKIEDRRWRIENRRIEDGSYFLAQSRKGARRKKLPLAAWRLCASLLRPCRNPRRTTRLDPPSSILDLRHFIARSPNGASRPPSPSNTPTASASSTATSSRRTSLPKIHHPLLITAHS